MLLKITGLQQTPKERIPHEAEAPGECSQALVLPHSEHSMGTLEELECFHLPPFSWHFR